jgi:hypothetical protein
MTTLGFGMDSIECGSASAVLRVDGDGIGTAVFSGLMVPANLLALGVLTMRAGVDRGALGLIYRVDQAAVCCDPVSMSASFRMLAPALRALPVAYVVNGGQAELHEQAVKRAADAGILRRAFRIEADAQAWLLRTVQALDANQRWWGARQWVPQARRGRGGRLPPAAPGPAWCA